MSAVTSFWPRRTTSEHVVVPYDHALSSFTQGVCYLIEQGKGQEVADLVERLIKATEDRGRRSERSTTWWQQTQTHLNTAIAMITLAAVLLRGGAILQQVNDHDTEIKALQSQMQTTVQLSVQIGALQAEVANLQSEVQAELTRVDRLLDSRR